MSNEDQLPVPDVPSEQKYAEGRVGDDGPVKAEPEAANPLTETQPGDAGLPGQPATPGHPAEAPEASQEAAPELSVGDEPAAAPAPDPAEPAPTETDNGPKADDPPQDGVSQDPNDDLTQGETL